MNLIARKRLLALFNLHQWVRRWYNLETPQSSNAENRPEFQIMGFSPLDKGQP